MIQSLITFGCGVLLGVLLATIVIGVMMIVQDRRVLDARERFEQNDYDDDDYDD